MNLKFWSRVVLISFFIFLAVVFTLAILPKEPPDASKRPDVAEKLNFLAPSVKGSITKIIIRQDYKHFDDEAGHCHKESRKICMREDEFEKFPWLLWHESGHAYHALLDKSGSDFTAKWRSIQGGILTEYGGTHYREDVAEYLEHVLLGIYTPFSAFRELDMLGFSWEEILPFFKKVELLFDYGFLTWDQYEQFMNKFYPSR